MHKTGLQRVLLYGLFTNCGTDRSGNLSKDTDKQISDLALFRQAVEDVRPLRAKPRTDSKAPRRKPAKLRSGHASSEPDVSENPSIERHPRLDAEDGSFHRKNGVQKKLLQKLKRGQYPVMDKIDLHNMTVAQAQTVLLRFLEESCSNNMHCVRVVHGKGLRSGNGPRLKLMARQLLIDHPRVLAYTRCKPSDGGDGATDLLLRSS